MTTTPTKIRVGLVVPHIFMHQDILSQVIFSPGELALELYTGLQNQAVDITLFSPGPIPQVSKNVTADLSYFEHELAGRNDSYIELLKKHPFTFVTLARQVQSELVAKAFAMANNDELDIVHIYTNEEDIALPFVQFCQKPVVLTHHDPFNFLVKYKNVFPKYKHLNWLSMSYAQRSGMPTDTTWVGNIYHGMDIHNLQPVAEPSGGYVAYLGRIIEPKGVHLAIEAIKQYNQTTIQPLKLKIAGKHYAGHAKDTYWRTVIEPELGTMVEYVGYIKGNAAKQAFLGNAEALLVPSTFQEPFGMVIIEALACGTPVIGLASGAIPELLTDGQTGFVVPMPTDTENESQISNGFAAAIAESHTISRQTCRQVFEQRFSLERMCREHLAVYTQLIK